MANGQTITPLRAGYGRSKDIVPGDSGTAVSALKRIAATTDSKAGLTLDQIITRMYALGIPLWSDKWGVVDLSFEVRNPKDDNARSAVRGVLHVCDHTASKGSRQKCKGHSRGESCDFEFISEGDSKTRWRMSNAYDTLPDVLKSQQSALAAARSTLKRRIEVLQGRFSKEDMIATPSIKQAIDLGLIGEDELGGKKPTASTQKRTTTKRPVTRNKKAATSKAS